MTRKVSRVSSGDVGSRLFVAARRPLLSGVVATMSNLRRPAWKRFQAGFCIPAMPGASRGWPCRPGRPTPSTAIPATPTHFR
ncbi:hypothetical protein PUN4_1000017 [Paraburkholderia unamae]|nr:hypothetical protein PUN4_1000017 [Paraburkholderia unamae]